MLVLADGVGGWNDHGIDPKAYSNKICSLVNENVKNHESLSYNEVKMDENILKSILVRSVMQNYEKGSSTLLVIYLDQGKNKNDLYTAYLGDSSYLIARPKSIGNFELLTKSEEQCHSFNFPYQVGTNGDDPNNAIISKHIVKEYDVIVAATDGLWDNLDSDEILQEINKLSSQENSININTSLLSEIISKKAEIYSYDRKHLSPFAKKARQYKYKNFIGGKPDDITVVSAQILHRNHEESFFRQLSDNSDAKSDDSCSTTDSKEFENFSPQDTKSN